MQNMYWFITISRRSDTDKVIWLFKKLRVPILYSSLAHGTAKSQMLTLLGIEASEKAVHHTVVTHNKLYELKHALESELQLDLPDRGIALAVPLASISTKNTLEYYAGGHAEDNMKDTDRKNIDLELIVAVCNRGHSENVMTSARAAGAGGGTVIHAKGTAGGSAEKFFGISIVDEKEIIYIVVKKSARNAIMQSITDNAGEKTEAHTLVFSLPVSETVGMRLFSE